MGSEVGGHGLHLSSKSFLVSGFTFKSLIYFELIFVYSVRQWSSVILLHVAVQFSHEETVLSPLCILGFFVGKLTRYAWVYFWALYSVPLIYVSVFMSIQYCFIIAL